MLIIGTTSNSLTLRKVLFPIFRRIGDKQIIDNDSLNCFGKNMHNFSLFLHQYVYADRYFDVKRGEINSVCLLIVN